MTQVPRGVRHPLVTATIRLAVQQSDRSKNEIGRNLGKNGRRQLQKWLAGGGITLANAERLEAAAGAPAQSISRHVRAALLEDGSARLEAQNARKLEELRRRLNEDA